MEVTIQVVPIADVTAAQLGAVTRLNNDCFHDVPQADSEEDFITGDATIARVFAFADGQMVGNLAVKRREIDFDGHHIVLGGVAGVCVGSAWRRQGIGRRMVARALEVLDAEGCDIACLNADETKTAYKLYEDLGFAFMRRPISFENVRGEVKYDTGTMFRPIHSQVLYDLVMNSQATFHYGRGYW